MRSVFLLLLALMPLAVVSQQLPEVPAIASGSQPSSSVVPELCDSTAGLLSPACDTSLAKWLKTSKAGLERGSIESMEAILSSANVLAWFEMLLATAQEATSSPTEMKGKLMEIVIKGYLKDFGRYDQCTAISSAHYCPTWIDSPLVPDVSLGVVALCLPDTCQAEDIGRVWGFALGHAQRQIESRSNQTIHIDDYFTFGTTCGELSVEWQAGTVVMVLICCFLATLVIAATVTEALKDTTSDSDSTALPASPKSSVSPTPEASLGRRLLGCFSLFTNVTKFGELRTGASTGCLDGIRTLSMCWVVMGHTIVWPMTSGLPGYANLGDMAPYYNPRALFGTLSGQAILSAEFSVDSFFYMSGFLAAYIGLKKLDGGAAMRPIKMAPFMYLDRFLRLTPVYFFIVLCYTYVSPVLSHGPFWTLRDQDACKDTWWQNLLYLQTVFMANQDFEGGTGLDSSCYGVSWYLADDMMYFYFVPFLIALAIWRRSIAYAAMFTGGLASVVAGFAIAAKYDLSPSPLDPTGQLYMSKYYLPPWTRISPYLIGTAFGVFWRDHSVAMTQLLQDRRWQAATWAISAAILGSCVWGNASSMQQVPSALYTDRARGNSFVAFAKPAWTFGLTALCMLCFARVGGAVQWFLEAPIFGYASKLTFTVYLVHPFVLYIWVRSLTGPLHYSAVSYSMNFVAILVTSAALGFVIHLTVEQPTNNLLSILMSSKRPTKGETDLPSSNADVNGARHDDSWTAMMLPGPFESEMNFLPAQLASTQMLALPAPDCSEPARSDQLSLRDYNKTIQSNDLDVPLTGSVCDLQSARKSSGMFPL